MMMDDSPKKSVQTTNGNGMTDDITTKELAGLTGISVQTIYSLVKRGEVTPVNQHIIPVTHFHFNAARNLE